MTTLAITEQVYGAARDSELTWHRIQDEAFERFSAVLSQLRRELGDDMHDPYWEETLGTLRIILHILASTPLPADHPALELDQLADKLLSHVQLIEAISPGNAPLVRLLGDMLIEMRRTARDPLGERVEELLAEPSSKDCLLLRSPRRLEAVRQRFVSQTPGLLVATPQILSGSEVFDRIIAVGPSKWFKSLVTAPRATSTHIVHLSITKDPRPALGILPGATSGRRPGTVQPSPIAESSEGAFDTDSFLAQPSISWERIANASRSATEELSTELDATDAKLILLADGTAAYINVVEGARNWVVDPTQQGGDRIRLDPWDAVGPGTFVILRMEGAGGIADIADGILGQRALRLREHQRGWKMRLREAVLSSTRTKVVAQLAALGSARANPENLRNWQSLDHIRTRDYADFLAIMRLLGIEEESRSLWDEMGAIMRAHTEAGMRLREELIRQLAGTDLGPLMTEGRMEVRAPQLGVGALSVVRVEEVSPDTYLVPRSRLDRAFDLEDPSWLG